MVSVPPSDARLLEMLEAFEATRTDDCPNGSNVKTAAAIGVSEKTVRRWRDIARERGLHLSPGARRVVERTGLYPMEARGGWIHTYDEEGKKIGATRWSAPEAETQSVIEQIGDAFASIPPAPAIEAPSRVDDDLATVYPLYDVHLGMHAWGKETGGTDYDLKIAGDDMRYAFGKVLALTPASRRAILIIGGDFFHADNTENQTPRNKHALDVDGRYFKIGDTGVALIAGVIETLLAKHQEVTVRVLRGNHDEHMHVILTFALYERYRDNDRVEIEKNPRDLFMTQWGRCMIAAHHGDKAPPERLTLYLSDVCSFWSETTHRYCFTGHVHKEQAKDIGPLRWESLRAFCPPDSYAAGMGYAARRALQAITFDKRDGLVLRAMDPIEREAA